MKKLVLSIGLVALLAAGCGDDDDDSATASTTSTTAGSTSTTETSAPTTSAPASAALVDPADTARAWIAAIGGGDDEGAMALTSARSLEAFGGPEGWADNETALAEGWGAWDFAEDLDVRSIELDDRTAIVVLHGEVSQEGPPREAWAALPVVATDDGDRVEPFLDLGTIEVDPAAGSEIDADSRLAAYVLGGRDVAFIVDFGQPAEPALQGFDGDQQLAELDVSGLEPGLHVLTVVLRRGEELMARTFEYRV